jgi:hypothetical protein
MRSAFWLSLHATYTCRHAGACCTSGWPIPIERDRVRQLDQAIGVGTLPAPVVWLRPLPELSDTAGVLAHDRDRCVFHAGFISGRNDPLSAGCRIQHALGYAALPSACQHFPRQCLIDDRGVFVTLSHYCPTAAAMLVSRETPVEIVQGPWPLPDGDPEGFDARGAWPPLLRPGVLMDHASFSAWEAHMVSWLGGTHNPDDRWSPECVVDLLHSHAERLSRWSPRDGELLDVVRSLAAERPSDGDAEREVAAPVAAIAGEWRSLAPIINRFLAAHAFASWTAYQGDGIVVQTRKLEHVLDVLRQQTVSQYVREGGALTTARLIEAIRQTDLQLVHLADRETLARELCAPRGRWPTMHSPWERRAP